jgi:hypothetical protein
LGECENARKWILNAIAVIEPQKHIAKKQTQSGIKDKLFSKLVLDCIAQACKKKSSSTTIEQWTMNKLKKLPKNPFSPVWQLIDKLI